MRPVDARLATVADRDGWRCWLCGGAVDRDVPPSFPGAPSVDHVVPRARGGTGTAANLRLAHRRCNTRRGSRMPELAWPAELGVVDPAPLWTALTRAQRRPGSWEVLALAGDEQRAVAAGAWVVSRAALLLGGGWEHRLQRVAPGHGTVTAVAVRATGGAGGGDRRSEVRRRRRR